MFVNLQIGLILPCRTGASVTGIPVVGVADTLLASPPILRLKESISQLICVTHKITKITAVTKARAKGRPTTRTPLRRTWSSRQIYQHKNTSILGSFPHFFFFFSFLPDFQSVKSSAGFVEEKQKISCADFKRT